MPKLAPILLVAMFLIACHSKNIDTAMHLVLRENPQSLDPVMSQDAIAAYALGPIYESLLQYHYLKRPYEVTTLLAEEMPRTSKDGLTVTVKIKKGVKFQDDPCFPGGRGRELVAEDFIYAWKRIADPKNHSEGVWVFEGRVVGFDQWREEASKSAADYSKPIEGFKALDDHTLQIKLLKKYPQLNYVLTMTYTVPVPHEAIEKYGVEFNRHPVGTGPFVLKEFVSSARLVYEKNPQFHGEKFPDKEPKITVVPLAKTESKLTTPKRSSKVSMAAEDCDPPKDIPSDCKIDGIAAVAEGDDFDYGKELPFVDKLVVHIMVERQPMFLSFLKGQLDHVEIPKDNFEAAVSSGGILKPELRAKGMVLTADQSSTEWWVGFNMRDPVVGKNKLLRKAMALAFDSQKHNELFGFGLSILSNQILPPSIAGFIPQLPAREYNLEKAKKLLAQAGFPDGKGLSEINYDTEGSTMHRQMGEFFKNQMAAIGVKIKVNLHTRPEYFDARKKGKTQIIYDGWIADYPDAENFMQLLYGPHSSPGMNNSSFKNAEYDLLYEKMQDMPHSKERQKIIEKMNAIAMEEQVWIPNWIAKLFNLRQAWLKNFLYSDFAYNVYKYYRVDQEQKKRTLKKF